MTIGDIKINDIKIKNDDDTYVTLGTTTDGCCGYFINNDDNIDASSYTTNSTITLEVDRLDQRISEIEEIIKGRNDTMDILELYKNRIRTEINDRYKGIIDEEYNNLDVVKEYNELINTFKINMKQLADKYNTNEHTYLNRSGYENDYEYELDDDIKSHIREKYTKAWDKELSDLGNFIEEVKAVLSLSEDKDYQVDVLKNYEILDKKGKLNI